MSFLLVVLAGIGPFGSLDTGVSGTASHAAGNPLTVGAAANTSGVTLVVWQDHRNTGFELFGARLTSAGVLDPTGLVIATRTSGFDPLLGRPAVATNGTDWLVTYRRGAVIEVVPVSQSGVVSAATVVSGGATEDPAVLFDNLAFRVSWPFDAGTRVSLLSRPVTPAGVPTGPAVMLTNRSFTAIERPALTFDAHTGLAWAWFAANEQPQRELFSVSLVMPGELREPSVPPGVTDVQAVRSSNETTVAYMTAASPHELWTMRRQTDGGSTARALAQSGALPYSYSIAAQLHQVHLASTLGQSLGGGVLSPGGGLATYQTWQAGWFDPPTLVGSDVQVRLVLDDARFGVQSANVVDLPGVNVFNQLDTARNGQRRARGAGQGARFITVWEDSRVVPHGLAWQAVSESGFLATPPGRLLAQSSQQRLELLSVAGEPSKTLALYRADGDVRCAAIGSDDVADAGVVVFPLPSSFATQVATNDGGALAIQNNVARFIGHDCTPTSAEFNFVDGGVTEAAVVWAETGYAAAWIAGAQVFARRVAAAGNLGLVSQVASIQSSDLQLAPGPGGVSLAVWQSANRIRFARLQGDTVLDPGGRLLTTSGVSFSARVAWTGTNWLVTWVDSFGGLRQVVMARRIDPNGTELDGAGVQLFERVNAGNLQLSLVPGAGQALLLEQRYDSTPTVQNQRTFFARLDLEPPGAPTLQLVTDLCPSRSLEVTFSIEPKAILEVTYPLPDAGTAMLSLNNTGPNNIITATLPYPGQLAQSISFNAVDDLGNRGSSTPAMLLWPSCDGGTPDAGTLDAGAADAGTTDAGTLDAGATDAGTLDAGPTDAGPTDAGPTDAGPTDAGTPDAGTMDAGMLDAGTLDAGTLDAGTLDAGTLDAGTLDAGTADAGTADAGPMDPGQLDGGLVDAGDAGPTRPGDLRVGCGCQFDGGSTAWLALMLLIARRRAPRSTVCSHAAFSAHDTPRRVRR